MEELELVFYNRSTLLEGPSWDKERNGILCVSIEQNCVYYLFLETGAIRTYQMDSQVGCAVFKDENTILVACYSGIYEIDFESGNKKFIVNINENSLLRYNDGKMDPKGRFIVGTTGYKCLAEKQNFLYSMENEKVRVLEQETTISNGIGFSNDGKYMYFVDTPTRKVSRYYYDINTGAASFDKDVITIENEGLPDGICVDSDDMIWVAQWGSGKVCKYNPFTGEKLKEIVVPCQNVSSCCLGGTENEYLYITTAQHDDNTRSEVLAGGLFRVRI